MIYKGFISYSHAADDQYAPALQSALQRFAKPFHRLRAMQIFRDRTDLSANPALWPVIQKSIQESEYFLLLASPQAAQSKWVKREIDYWLNIHQGSVDKLLIICTDGEIIWDTDKNDFNWIQTNSLPKLLDWDATNPSPTTLQNRFKEEPFYLDQRWVKSEKDVSLRNPRFLDDIATLAATMHGKSKSDLIGDDVKEHNRYRRVRRMVQAALTLLVLLTSGFGIYANRQRIRAEDALRREIAASQEAERRRQEAETQRRIAQDKSSEAEQAAQAEADARSVAEKRRLEAEKQTQIAINQRRRAEQATDAAEQAAKKEKIARQQAQEQLRRSQQLLYDSDIYIAQKAISDGNMAKAIELLKAHQVSAISPTQDDLRGFEWQYLWSLTHKEDLTINDPYDPIVSMAVSQDKEMLATGGEGGTIKLFDMRNRKELITLPTRYGADVISLTFSPKTNTLVSVQQENYDEGQSFRLLFWDLNTHQVIDELKEVPLIKFSLDGKTFATVRGGAEITLWDAETREPIRGIGGRFDAGIRCLAFSPDGKLLATGDSESKLTIWDVDKGGALVQLSDHTSPIVDVTFSPDGKLLATASMDRTAILWDVLTKKPINRLRAHGDTVNAVAFSPDGKMLATGSLDNTIKLWEVVSGKEIKSLGGHYDAILSMGFARDGNSLVSVSLDRTVKIWNLRTSFEPVTLPKSSAEVWAVALTSDSKILAACNGDNTVKLWDVSSQSEIATLGEHKDTVFTLALSPDNKTLATGSKDNTVKLWDMQTRRVRSTLLGHTNTILALAFSPDGKLLASAGWDKQILLWDVQSGNQVGRLYGQYDVITSLAFSPDSQLLASGGNDRSLLVWDISRRVVKESLYDRESRGIMRRRDYSVFSVAFLPDGKTLAAGDSNNDIRLWNIETKEELPPLKGHTDAVMSISISPDHKTMVTGGRDGTIRLWDINTRKELITLTGHAGSVRSVVFSRDSMTIASGSVDRTVKLWNAFMGRQMSAPRR